MPWWSREPGGRRFGLAFAFPATLTSTPVRPQRHLGQLGEGFDVGAHDFAPPRARRGGDDQIVNAAWAAHAAAVREQRAVRAGHVCVVALDAEGLQRRGEERFALGPALPISQLCAYHQLGDADGCDRHVVLVVDQLLDDSEAIALGVDEHRRIEDQSCQGSVSAEPTHSRSSRSSAPHAGSGRCARSISFTARPVPPLAGPIVATARPRRTTTKDSCSDSTLSNTSEKRRAASVALSCFTKSDYQGNARRLVAILLLALAILLLAAPPARAAHRHNHAPRHGHRAATAGPPGTGKVDGPPTPKSLVRRRQRRHRPRRLRPGRPALGPRHPQPSLRPDRPDPRPPNALRLRSLGAPEGDYPASNYGFDIFISTGITHPVGDITYGFATVLNGIWLGLIFVLRLILALLGLAFSLNPFGDGQTMAQVSAALGRLYAARHRPLALDRGRLRRHLVRLQGPPAPRGAGGDRGHPRRGRDARSSASG